MLADPDETDLLQLLYPEMLTRQQLCHILQSRFVLTKSEESTVDSHELIEKFRKFIQPQPQRTFSTHSSAIGKVLSERQSKPRKRPAGFTHMSVSSIKRNRLSPRETRDSDQDKSRKLYCSFEPFNEQTPAAAVPSSYINFEKKVISLGSKSSVSTSRNNRGDGPSSPSKPPTSPVKTTVSKVPTSPVKTTISLKRPSVDSLTTTSSPKKICLTVPEPTSSTAEDQPKTTETKPKKKIVPITWP